MKKRQRGEILPLLFPWAGTPSGIRLAGKAEWAFLPYGKYLLELPL